MKKRAGIILHSNKNILLIKRIKEENVYYVIPGGTVKQGETFEQAAKRELYEEIGLCINKLDYGFTVNLQTGTEKYFFAKIDVPVSFTIQGEEAERASEINQYIPMWVSIDIINDINLLPPQLKKYILKAAQVKAGGTQSMTGGLL